jgi:hypothetical protein
MKKDYFAPTIKSVTIHIDKMLLNGSVRGKDKFGYGGIDDGTNTPGARRNNMDEGEDDEEF